MLCAMSITQQWEELADQIRDSIHQLPEAAEFTEKDISRVLEWMQRINTDVINSVPLPIKGVDPDALQKVIEPIYGILVGEIVALCCEIIRMEKERE